MPLSEKEILEVLELFQKSGWEDLTLESGGIRLSISKSGQAPGRSVASRAPAPVAPVHSAPTPTPPAAGVAIHPRWIAVKAPMLGTFYAASKPGAPPFVSVGQTVAAEDNLCIIEVMKLMNYVKAGTGGTIAHIAVSNGDLVEFDQPLVYIDPA